ncbi:putative ABC-type xenobiotic transporter [Helianthus annuus]|uniref:ABC-type xenobiotic transporter n=1 Tax=Helianthus annuus TaxID=4232 RepID=A0A9K3DI75_HELAN|nr:putative ABC-type xenobiotic transporter [Helianthus annuus]KAJ0813682.1 putative ABC-type xenobiotic transporter [Helianthus annuus]
MFLLIIPGVIYGNILAKKEEKIQEAYTVSGGIAEQAFSLIKTVHYYVGEKKMVSRFSDALIPTLALGIKQGLLKGMVLGSIGILFSIFAFMSWYGSILVIKKGIKGSSLYPDYYDTNTVKVNYCTLVYAAFMLLVIWV